MLNEKVRSILRRDATLVALGWLLLLPGSALCEEGLEVENLSNRRYLEKVLEAIGSAKDSIFVVMYHVPLDPSNKNSPVTRLVDALIEAKRRGVGVTVILDQEIDTERVVRGRSAKNVRAYHYLRENGIPASFDTLSKRTHAKLVVVDREIVILGSSNWSREALDQNYESNLLIRSPKIAHELIEDFQKIELLQPEKASEWKGSLRIPRSFLLEAAGPRLHEGQAGRGIRVYLFLLFKARGRSELTVDYGELATQFGLSRRMSREAYRRQLIKVLRKLDRDYGLLRFYPKHGKEAHVVLLNPEDTSKSYEEPQSDYFELPLGFFELGWLARLSPRAAYSLLILYDQWSYPRRQPAIEVGLEALAKRYHLAPKTLSLAFRELAHQGLLEIYYGKTIDFEKREFETASYVLLPFYNPKVREEELRRLEQLYGKRMFERAVSYAQAFSREKDPETLQTLVGLMMNYSGEWVDLAMKEVILKKSVGNPARSLPYLIGILQEWREQGQPTV